jgi:hypothetical protein
MDELNPEIVDKELQSTEDSKEDLTPLEGSLFEPDSKIPLSYEAIPLQGVGANRRKADGFK